MNLKTKHISIWKISHEDSFWHEDKGYSATSFPGGKALETRLATQKIVVLFPTPLSTQGKIKQQQAELQLSQINIFIQVDYHIAR